MNGYTEGNALEKGVYTERGKKAPLQKDTWCAAATTSPVEGATSPLIGTPLKYEGYSEKECLLCLAVSLRVQAVNAPQFIQWRKEELIHQEPIILPIL